jgi:hypothetical protein
VAVKLVIVLLVLAVVLSVAVGCAFWYFKNKAEMSHEEEMKDKELRHEREQSLFDE